MKKKKNISKKLSLDKIKIAKLNNTKNIVGGGAFRAGPRILPTELKPSEKISCTGSTKTGFIRTTTKNTNA